MNPFRRWFQLNGFGRVSGVDRFWRKVAKTTDPAACWPWANGRCGCGYVVGSAGDVYGYAY